MIREKSCGAVIFADTDRGRLFLIERMRGGHLSLCKGHVERGESEHRTARREIREETGLEVRFVDGFRTTIEYSPYSGCTKKVVFYLAQSLTIDAVPQPSEVSEILWLPLESAVNALTHETDKGVLRAAAEFLANEAAMAAATHSFPARDTI